MLFTMVIVGCIAGEPCPKPMEISMTNVPPLTLEACKAAAKRLIGISALGFEVADGEKIYVVPKEARCHATVPAKT